MEKGKIKKELPKPFFSNERTLLSWLNTVTFLSISGVTIMSNSGILAEYVGLSMIFVTILFAAYALYTYFKRMGTLEGNQEIKFGDKFGPPILISVLCLVLFGLAFFTIFGDSTTTKS